uniref:CHK kinase-like domain-containing protein n=1 Tax=Plectus sambesii TaxID=2011161 RepID=A0A914X1D6_9BILA
MEQAIENTYVTSSLLESGLQKVLNTKCLISKWSSKILSPERGYLSMIIRIELEWSSSEGSSLPQSVILKVPTTSKLEAVFEQLNTESTNREQQTETSHNFAPNLTFIHNTECAFYQLQPAPHDFLKVPRLFFAKHIAEEDPNGYLVMEDLSQIVADGHVPQALSLDAIFEVADFLAALHAYSLTNSGWQQDSVLMFNGRRLSDRIRGNGEKVRNGLTNIAEHLPILQKYVDRTHDLYTCLDPDGIIWLPREEDNLPIVICHGDIWMNNILWKKDKEGQPSDHVAAIIDWQGSHHGAVTEDLATLLIGSVSTEIRRNHLQDILEHYYQRLQEKLGTPPPFDMNKLYQSFRYSYQRSVFRSIADYQVYITMCDGDDTKKQIILSRCQGFVEDAFAILDGKEFGSYSH